MQKLLQPFETILGMKIFILSWENYIKSLYVPETWQIWLKNTYGSWIQIWMCLEFRSIYRWKSLKVNSVSGLVLCFVIELGEPKSYHLSRYIFNSLEGILYWWILEGINTCLVGIVVNDISGPSVLIVVSVCVFIHTSNIIILMCVISYNFCKVQLNIKKFFL